MNRETKIGLLVGLAFIIVIGVLLSDHVQTSTQTRPAVLAVSGEVVRSGTAAPGTEHPGAAKVVPPATIEPAGQVATTDSLDLLNQAPQDIQIGPAAASQTQMVGVTRTTGAAGGQVATGPAVDQVVFGTGGNESAGSVGGATIVTPMAGSESARVEMPTNVGGSTAILPVNAVGGEQGKAAIAPPRTHTATSGDSVYKMAVKYYGGYSKAREAMIVGANPTLAKGGKIVIGKSYVIPNLPGVGSTGTEVATEVATPTPKQTVVPVVTPPAATPVRPAVVQAPKTPAKATAASYTVKSGDSLARIASKNGVTVAQLKAANKDVLKGSETLQIGMTLRVPDKQVAAAN